MAEQLILEFDGVGQPEYEAVNRQLGIDHRSGAGDWPSGLLVHTAGSSDGGSFVVTEIWASRADQEAFMQQRLGAALQAGGITAPPKVTWVSLISEHSPGR